jgi:predicted transcriptional regulator
LTERKQKKKTKTRKIKKYRTTNNMQKVQGKERMIFRGFYIT